MAPPKKRRKKATQRAGIGLSGSLLGITGVSFKGATRGSTNLAGGRQGSHRTAHRAVYSMFRNNLLGRTLAGGVAELTNALTRLHTVPAVQNLRGQHATNLATVTTLVANAATMPQLENATNQFATFINLIPGSAGSTGSLTGHGEAGNAGLLDEYEDRLRGARAQRYTRIQVAQSMFELLDYQPQGGITEQTAADNLFRHLVNMRNSWPRSAVDARAEILARLTANAGADFLSYYDVPAQGRIIALVNAALTANTTLT